MAKVNPQNQTKFTSQNVLNNVYDDVNKALAVISYGNDGQNVVAQLSNLMALRLEYDGSSNPIYVGLAAPGTLVSQSLWLIRKLTFDGSGNVTAIQYANGVPLFDQVWNDRASLSYV
jgi:hypothetical protein